MEDRLNLWHFVETRDDLRSVSQEQLLQWFRRGLALVAWPTQAGIDLLLPVRVRNGTTSCAVIQVKNKLSGRRPADDKVRAPTISGTYSRQRR